MTQPHYIDREAVKTRLASILTDLLDDAEPRPSDNDIARAIHGAMNALSAPMEAVAWRIRPKGALGDVMGFQVVTDKYTAQDYAKQPAFEVQALAVIPTQGGEQSSGNTGELNTEGKG